LPKSISSQAEAVYLCCLTERSSKDNVTVTIVYLSRTANPLKARRADA
jgi:hypothetical protein